MKEIYTLSAKCPYCRTIFKKQVNINKDIFISNFKNDVVMFVQTTCPNKQCATESKYIIKLPLIMKYLKEDINEVVAELINFSGYLLPECDDLLNSTKFDKSLYHTGELIVNLICTCSSVLHQAFTEDAVDILDSDIYMCNAEITVDLKCSNCSTLHTISNDIQIKNFKH